MNRYRQYEPDHMEPMTREEEEAALAEQRADDIDADRAYEEYRDGLDERLADRFPEAF